MGMQDKTQKPENGLYVGDLEEGITEEQLFVEFRKFGSIQFVKLHRYPFIGKSKHFAFIFFSSKEEAEKAKDAMNYKELLRHPMRITKIQEHEKEANLFFAGFAPETTLKQIDQFFSTWGSVFSVKFSCDENRKSRGYGWVQFEKKEHADIVLEKALEQQGKLQFDDQHQILVKRFVKKGTTEREDRRNNLYVKNFWGPLDQVDLENDEIRKALIVEMETKLKEWFLEFGDIISVFVKIDTERKAPFAFVSFNHNSEAKKAQQQLGNMGKKDPLGTGRPMYVGWAQTKTDRKQQRDNNVNAKYIYADHLARNVTEEMIRNTLKESGYGDIQLIRLEKMQQGYQQIIRIGYLIFDQASDAHKLIRTYKENENIEKIKSLFELPQNDQTRPLFQYLFPQQFKQNSQRKNMRGSSPIRRMPLPFMIPQMPGMGGMGGMGGMMPQVPGFPPNQGPRMMPPPFQGGRGQPRMPYPKANIPQVKTEYVAVPYDKKQDLLDLISNLDNFFKKTEPEQREHIGQMLTQRLKLKHADQAEEFQRKIVGVLIDKENFSIEENINMLKDENLFEEAVKDTMEAFASQSNQE